MNRPCRECGADITGTHFNRRFCDDCNRPGPKNQRIKDRNPDYFYNHSLKRFYGIDREKYDKMGDSQGWLCAICGGPPSGSGNGGRLVVDHCHSSGKVRALLCALCNKGIGALKDDPEIARKAADYLKEHCV